MKRVIGPAWLFWTPWERGMSEPLVVRMNGHGWRLCAPGVPRAYNGRPQTDVRTKTLETVFGDNLFGFFVDESKRDALSR